MPMNNFIYPNWNAPARVKSLITTRLGGVSVYPFDTFNLGTHVGDNLDSVLQNRQILAGFVPSKPFWLNQTHSDKAICIDNISPDNDISLDYDASFTYKKNQVCVAMSADCIPVLLTDKNGSFAAAIHAGWRGVENNIICKTISTIDIPGANILAYIAPAICKEHFEVGPEVFDMFILQDKNYKYFFKKNISDKFQCDLSAIAKQQLLKLGLLEQNIYLSEMCTYCRSELFFSYRRNGITGRMASLIWLS
ncbi:MAG: hypothetical protein K0R49_498 [Burkholderiales bacterium]|nr:hypothetical protein [Burkholderiales bacterium]